MRTLDPGLGIHIEELGGAPEHDVFSFRSQETGVEVRVENSLSHQPAGVRTLAKSLGIKYEGQLDFTVIQLGKAWTGAGVYTRSLCPSDAVKFDRQVTAQGEVELICVLSKNANVFAPRSAENIELLADALSAEFGVARDRIILSCTGIIGVPLPMERILPRIQGVSADLKPQALDTAAKAILTTDRQEKCASVKLGEVQLCGFVKGAGMIEPNMATMLGYFFTNAAIEKSVLDAILKRAVDRSLNCISVDSDTSTSDTIVLVASGDVPLSEPQLRDFEAALTAMMMKLGRDIVAQAEGATKIIEVTVAMNTSYEEARRVAKRIINSPLMKCAVYGSDPNWGRIVMAVGKPGTDFALGEIKKDQLQIKLSGELIYDRGEVHEHLNKKVFELMRDARTVTIDVTINEPAYTARVWGCDLSEQYVKINAEYST